MTQQEQVPVTLERSIYIPVTEAVEGSRASSQGGRNVCPALCPS